MKNLYKVIGAVGILFSVCKANAQPPAGYYNNAANKSCATLKTALKTILNTGMTPKAYSALWTQYAATELKPRTVGVGSANVIYDIYSINPNGVDPYQFTPNTDQCGSYSKEGDCYNREHSVPQSWFNTGTSAGPGTDFNHIFPTDAEVNARHGNNVYGEVATASWTSLTGNKSGSSAVAGITGTVFEPIDSFKGDIARAFLYFITMYEDDMASFSSNADNSRAFAYNTFPSAKVDYLKLMIKWHKLDPVSAKELARNNAAYSFQKNRNPFVDRPEFVDSVWNGNCPGLIALPVDLISFKGKLIDNNVSLSWEVGVEYNVMQYEIEKSYNGTNFYTINAINATNKSNYFYNDKMDESYGRRVFYRIKKLDKDGKFTYSEIFTVHIPNQLKYSVYPNPTRENIVVNFNQTITKTVEIMLNDVTGKTVYKNTFNNPSNIVINTTNITNGTYFLVANINGENVVNKVVVQH